MVEQRTHIPYVSGSIPLATIKALSQEGAFFICEERLAFKKTCFDKAKASQYTSKCFLFHKAEDRFRSGEKLYGSRKI